MIPSNIFYDLIDAGVSFRLVRRNLNGPDIEYLVSAAKDNEVVVSMGGQKLKGTAPAVLASLNFLLALHDNDAAGSMTPDAFAWYDTGTILNYKILLGDGKSGRAGLPDSYEVESVLIWGEDGLGSKKQGVYEVHCNGRVTLHHCGLQERSVVEVGRVSRRSISKPLHAKLAAEGSGWTGRPSAEEAFVRLYGQDELDRARQDFEASEKVKASQLMEAKRTLGY